MTSKLFLGAAIALTLVTGAASAETAIATAESTLGQIFVDGDGMSLYTFDKDAPAVSNCYGDCAVKWPPLAAAGGAEPQGEFGIIMRTGGDKQWTYKGQPLYLWVKDQTAGDVTGDGVKGVWHLARP